MTDIGEPWGRQPAQILITPSTQSPWVSWGNLDRRFSKEQYSEMSRLDLDPDTVEVIMVRRVATAREAYWPSSQPAPYFEFECPVIFRRRDGKVQIITPAGFRKFVPADGWATAKPRIIRRGYW